MFPFDGGRAEFRLEYTLVHTGQYPVIRAQTIGEPRHTRLSTIVCKWLVPVDARLQHIPRQINLEPTETLIVRHVRSKKSFNRVLLWLITERPGPLFDHQRIQWETLEKAITKGRYIDSFIGQEPVRATFAGLDEIGEWETLDLEGYRTSPGTHELEGLGMSGRTEEQGDCLAFDLKPLDLYAD